MARDQVLDMIQNIYDQLNIRAQPARTAQRAMQSPYGNLAPSPEIQAFLQRAAPAAETCGGKCGSRGPFAEYAPAGLLRFVSTGANAFDDDSVSVSGEDLPGDSVLLVVSHRTAAGANVPNGDVVVSSILADNIPAPLGDGGASCAIADITVFNASGIAIQNPAQKNLTVQIQFGPLSAANDVMLMQVLAKGQMALRKQLCRAA